MIPFDHLRARIVQLVKAGELTPARAERVRLLLELEATGEAEGFYGPKQYAQRRREARSLGFRVEDAGRPRVDFDLGAILRAYDESAAWAQARLTMRDQLDGGKSLHQEPPGRLGGERGEVPW